MSEMRALKEALINVVDGLVMLRQDKTNKSELAKGIRYYKVFFNNPASANKEAICETIRDYGYKPTESRVVGGAYGFVISFRAEYIEEGFDEPVVSQVDVLKEHGKSLMSLSNHALIEFYKERIIKDFKQKTGNYVFGISFDEDTHKDIQLTENEISRRFNK